VVHLSGLHTLDRAECIELLRTVTVGRIAFTERGLPAIQPVNFSMDGSNVIIRTSSGGKLAAAVTGAMVAFETDEVDAATRSGWSGRDGPCIPHPRYRRVGRGGRAR
jgi:nitroimidazol reductase NimA-like FMN-containing flavoprotein (pyridoxamine 5'-phosphate oxidase superfamily)